MKRDAISDHELLALIHKNIDMKVLKEQNKTITKTRVDKLLQTLINQLKHDEPYSPKTINKLIINIDGASRGNPGKAGIGVAIFDKELNLIKEACEYIGTATNNIAEYKSLILGIREAIKSGAQETLFKTDSELLAKQIMGKYKVKNPQLSILFNETQTLLKKLPKWEIKHVPRKENKVADSLANKGIDMHIRDCSGRLMVIQENGTPSIS